MEHIVLGISWSAMTLENRRLANRRLLVRNGELSCPWRSRRRFAALRLGHATVICEVVWHILTALTSRPQLALSRPDSRQDSVVLVRVVSCMGWTVLGKLKKPLKCVDRKTPPEPLNGFLRENSTPLLQNVGHIAL